jgi:hypothetical protein
MAKKIKLELTERQFEALLDVVDSASTVFNEIKEEQKNIALVDRMLKKNGYKREYN